VALPLIGKRGDHTIILEFLNSHFCGVVRILMWRQWRRWRRWDDEDNGDDRWVEFPLRNIKIAKKREKGVTGMYGNLSKKKTFVSNGNRIVIEW